MQEVDMTCRIPLFLRCVFLYGGSGNMSQEERGNKAESLRLSVSLSHARARLKSQQRNTADARVLASSHPAGQARPCRARNRRDAIEVEEGNKQEEGYKAGRQDGREDLFFPRELASDIDAVIPFRLLVFIFYFVCDSGFASFFIDA
jgi:hypothetical protein